MKSLRRLALAADLVAFAVVILGSWTRINAAGMTCPDWPMCRGELFPNMSGGTLWEWTHRLLAFSLAPLIAAVCVVAWRSRVRSSPAAVASGVVAALFLIQVALGAATVRLDNTPLSVVLHWGTAMAVIAALTAVAIFAHLPEPGAARGTPPSPRIVLVMLGITAVVAFITMCIGAYVSSSGAGLACLSLPGCAGNVVVYTPGQVVQMLHRVAAAATLLCASIAFALTWTRGVASYVRLAAGAGILLVFIQVILGLLNVALRLPTDLREVHAANAALLFLAFVAATAFAAIDSYAPSLPAYERPH
ncbi:MAG TPA: COX15/CtaA family protein [Candidatus Dormibacteraeota bacterium]|nr:COX15/CtaA family protein [Candidatus Dormibacteraeota bacterium]